MYKVRLQYTAKKVIMYLLDQGQEVENGYQKSLRHNRVTGHPANLQQTGTLEVKQQFHQERLPVFHIQ